MEYQQWVQKRPWLKGLIWGWIMFLVLTGIDYHNGELPTGDIPRRFLVWSVGGLLFGYLRAFLFGRKKA
jgi:hypothetical protein